MRPSATLLLVTVLLAASGRSARGDDGAPLAEQDADREIGVLRAQLARRVVEGTPFSPASVHEVIGSGRTALRRDPVATEASGERGLVVLTNEHRALRVREDLAVHSSLRSYHSVDLRAGITSMIGLTDSTEDSRRWWVRSVKLAPSVFLVTEKARTPYREDRVPAARLVSTRTGTTIDLDTSEASRIESSFNGHGDPTALSAPLKAKLARVGLTIHPDRGFSVAPGGDRLFIYRMPSARARGGMVRAGRARPARKAPRARR